MLGSGLGGQLLCQYTIMVWRMFMISQVRRAERRPGQSRDPISVNYEDETGLDVILFCITDKIQIRRVQQPRPLSTVETRFLTNTAMIRISERVITARPSLASRWWSRSLVTTVQLVAAVTASGTRCAAQQKP